MNARSLRFSHCHSPARTCSSSRSYFRRSSLITAIKLKWISPSLYLEMIDEGEACSRVIDRALLCVLLLHALLNDGSSDVGPFDPCWNDTVIDRSLR